jgi:hypothetical protein
MERERSILVLNGASSLAHVAGRNLRQSTLQSDLAKARLRLRRRRPGRSRLAPALTKARRTRSGAASFVGPKRRSLRGFIDIPIEREAVLVDSGEAGLALDASGSGFGPRRLNPRRRTLVSSMTTIERAADVLAIKGRIGRSAFRLALQP